MFSQISSAAPQTRFLTSDRKRNSWRQMCRLRTKAATVQTPFASSQGEQPNSHSCSLNIAKNKTWQRSGIWPARFARIHHPWHSRSGSLPGSFLEIWWQRLVTNCFIFCSIFRLTLAQSLFPNIKKKSSFREESAVWIGNFFLDAPARCFSG